MPDSQHYPYSKVSQEAYAVELKGGREADDDACRECRLNWKCIPPTDQTDHTVERPDVGDGERGVYRVVEYGSIVNRRQRQEQRSEQGLRMWRSPLLVAFTALAMRVLMCAMPGRAPAHPMQAEGSKA